MILQNKKGSISKAGLYMMIINDISRVVGPHGSGVSIEFINSASEAHFETYSFNAMGIVMLNKICDAAYISNMTKDVTDASEIISKRLWVAIREEQERNNESMVVNYRAFKFFAAQERKPHMDDDPELKHGVVTGDFLKVRISEQYPAAKEAVAPNYEAPAF